MKKWLCYFELHVEDQTFYVHVIVEGETSDAALDQLDAKETHGKHYQLQSKGCLGEFSEELAMKYMALEENA